MGIGETGFRMAFHWMVRRLLEVNLLLIREENLPGLLCDDR
jgi:hypothetical protein